MEPIALNTLSVVSIDTYLGSDGAHSASDIERGVYLYTYRASEGARSIKNIASFECGK